MKVFMTGCTSPQASKTASESLPSFAGIIYLALTQSGCDVTWSDPSIKMDKEYLSQFDAVLVGISSPMGLTSHRLYGALSVVNIAYELGNLSIFVDAPEPHKVWNGLRGVYKNPKELVKDFYIKRKEFNDTLEPKNFEKVFAGLSKLYTEIWPKTLIPGYPWTNPESILKYIPNVDPNNVFALVPDSALLNVERGPRGLAEGGYWCIDDPKTDWFKKTEKHLTHETMQYRDGRTETNQDILVKLNNATGALISTYRDGASWWLPSLAQALFVGVPVVTDWRLTISMGQEWGVLPFAIEEMSREERLVHANTQKESYKNNIPTWDVFKNSVVETLFEKDYATN
jgi:hypothetical protein